MCRLQLRYCFLDLGILGQAPRLASGTKSVQNLIPFFQPVRLASLDRGTLNEDDGQGDDLSLPDTGDANSTLAQLGYRHAGADEAISYGSPKPYFFQDLDLIKIQKIIKCETSTKGA